MVCGHFFRHLGTKETYYTLLPCNMRSPIEKALAVATMSSAMNDAIFPVLSASDRAVVIDWIAGPRPLLRTKRLDQGLQNLLVSDGLQLVSLPSCAETVYKMALPYLTSPCVLGKMELCDFLGRKWGGLHADIFQNVALEGTGIRVLSERESVMQLLDFLCRADPEFKHFEKVPLLLTGGGKLTAFGQHNVRFNSDRELLPNHPDLFIEQDAWRAMREITKHQPAGICKLGLANLLPYKDEVEAHVLEQSPAFKENSYLQHLWSFFSKADSTAAMNGWQILPIYRNDSPDVVCLDRSCQTVDADTMRLEPGVQQALLGAGIFLLQGDLLEKSARNRGKVEEAGIVTTDHQLANLLLTVNEQNAFSALTAGERHALLAYFSGMLIKEDKVPKDISRLPLFKLAEDGFTDLRKSNVTFCCLDPRDKRARALEKLMSSGAKLLAWPTRQVKPIYEFLDIPCHSGEDFMVHFIIPDLERLCREHTGGTLTRYFQLMNQLNEFIAEGSSKVKDAVMDKQIISSANHCPSTANSLVDPDISVVNCFKHKDFCSEHLPEEEIYRRYPEMLHCLGLQKSVPPDLLLKCAQDLDAQKEAQLQAVFSSVLLSRLCWRHVVHAALRTGSSRMS